MTHEHIKSNGAVSSGGPVTLGLIVRLLPGLAKLADALCMLAAGFLTYKFFVYYSYKTVDTFYAAIVFNCLLTLGLFYIGGLYSLDSLLRPARQITAIFLGSSTSFALMLAAAFSLKVSEDISRLWVFEFFVAEVVALVGLRLLSGQILASLEDRQLLARKVLFFGDSTYVSRLQAHVTETEARLMTVQASFAGDIFKPDNTIDRNTLDHKLEDLMVYLRTHKVDDIVIAMPWHASRDIKSIVDRLREVPVNVYLGADVAGLELGLRPPRDSLRDAAVFELVGRPMSGWDLITKTVADFVLALLLIVLLSPFLILIGILIKFDSPGPALYRQKRYGFNNQVFEIYKFRTMRNEDAPVSKTVQAVPGDARITRLGHFLRRTSLDELPQLLNVLGGSMSLVGPRPHAVDHNEEYAKKIRGYLGRHRVKPGITGLAQVKGFRGVTDTLDKMQNRVKYDMLYADNWSLFLDLKILAKTILVCIGAKNAY